MSSTTPTTTTPSATDDSPRVITTVNPATGDELSQYAAWIEQAVAAASTPAGAA